jgi:N-methylhydantoinase A
VTDANLVLGYLDPGSLAGGTMTVSVPAAVAAIEQFVARPLGLSITDAAYGIHRIANAAMASAVRMVTVERGIDPREFSLFAFGGAGPLHAARMAEECSVRDIVVPDGAGVMSAAGLLSADVAVDDVRTQVRDADTADPAQIEVAFGALEAELRADLEAQGAQGVPTEVVREVDVRYKGQAHELAIRVGPGPLDLDELASSFYAVYRDRFGIDRSDPIELVNYRVRLVARVARLEGRPIRGGAPGTPNPTPPSARRAYFPEAGGYVETPVWSRPGMNEGDRLIGPALIESADTTVVVPPGFTARVDEYASLVLSSEPHPASQGG